jgi:hypothetical protein
VRGFLRSILLSAIVLGMCTLNCVAQQDPGPDPSADTQSGLPLPVIAPVGQPSASQDTDAGRDKNKSAAGTSKDRLFFALPNFLTLENAGQVPPLSTAEKFRVTARASFDPVEYFWYAGLAGISQWENSEPGYGQGAEGYAKRFGAYFADGTIENFTTSAIFPSLLHQDPRYFQMGHGGFWRRTGYAVSRIFVTRTDSGHETINLSEILGSASAASISTYSYHPVGERNIPNAASVWGSEVGYDTLTFVVKEFWPDIRRKMKHSKTN